MGSNFEHVFGRLAIERDWYKSFKNLSLRDWLTMNKYTVSITNGDGCWKPIFGTCVWWLSEPKQK